MTTTQVINLDCREKKNQEIIQKVLRQIKPLSKYSDEEDIPLSAIEKAVTVMCKKYALGIGEINPDARANNEYIIWRARLIKEKGLKPIDMVCGISIYEVFAKMAIRLYAEVRKTKEEK